MIVIGNTQVFTRLELRVRPRYRLLCPVYHYANQVWSSECLKETPQGARYPGPLVGYVL